MKSLKETNQFSETAVLKKIESLKTLASVKFGAAAGRRDFYDYLAAVYEWVRLWQDAEKNNRLRKLVAKFLQLETLRLNADAFHLVVTATCPKNKTATSKYAIALNNAARAKVPPGDLVAFFSANGGPAKLCTHRPDWVMRNIYRRFKKDQS